MPYWDETELAMWRRNRGPTQKRMAEQMGISLATYKRFERGDIARPPLAYFVNASILLDVPLERLIDQRHLEWQPLDGSDDATHPDARIRASDEWLARNRWWIVG